LLPEQAPFEISSRPPSMKLRSIPQSSERKPARLSDDRWRTAVHEEAAVLSRSPGKTASPCSGPQTGGSVKRIWTVGLVSDLRHQDIPDTARTSDVGAGSSSGALQTISFVAGWSTRGTRDPHLPLAGRV
jgi:hypothetical protein